MNLLHWLVLLPLAGMVCACVWREPTLLRRLGQLSVWAVLFAISLFFLGEGKGTVVVPMGNWGGAHAWFWVVDGVSALFLAAISAGVFFYTLGMWKVPLEEEHPLIAPILFLLVAGMNLSVCAGDFISLLAGWELSLFAAYALFAIGAKYLEIRQAVTILGFNFVGTLMLLVSVGLCYGIFRTFGLAQIASRIHAFTGNGWFICFVVLFLSACGVKAAFIPLLLGSENIHRILPTSLGAFLAGVASKLGVYVVLRMTGSVFSHEIGYVQWLLLAMGLLAGWIAAKAVFKDVRMGRVTSSLLMGQLGICLIAMMYQNEGTFQATLLYALSAMVVDGAIFLMCCSLVRAHDGDDLMNMGGAWGKTSPLSILWIILIVVVMGVPPLSGFWGKYILAIHAGGALQSIFIAAISFVLFLCMIKAWRLLFFGGGLFASRRDVAWKSAAWAALFLALLSLALGLASEKHLDFMAKCATEILDRPAYHAAVMETLRVY